MDKAISTYRPASNWVTALLLALVVIGFGLFAQHRADAAHHEFTTGNNAALVVAGAGK